MVFWRLVTSLSTLVSVKDSEYKIVYSMALVDFDFAMAYTREITASMSVSNSFWLGSFFSLFFSAHGPAYQRGGKISRP